MKKILFLTLMAATASGLHAQSPVIIQKDPVIEKMVTEVSADSMRTTVTKLVSFGTRNTLSKLTTPKGG